MAENKLTKKIKFSAETDTDISLRLGMSTTNWFSANYNTTDSGFEGELQAEKNEVPIERSGKLRAYGVFNNRNVSSPWVTFSQEKHPYYYIKGGFNISIEGETRFGPPTTAYIGEEGGYVLIQAYSVLKDGTERLNSLKYYNLTTSGDNNVILVSTVTTSEYVTWRYQAKKNSTLEKKLTSFTVVFDNGLDSTWTDTVYLSQSKHTIVYGTPVFSVKPTEVPAYGGICVCSAYVPVDGVNTLLTGFTIASSSGFTDGDISYEADKDKCQWIITFKESEEKTSDGRYTRKVQFKVPNPTGTANTITSDEIYQHSYLDATKTFTFEDGSTTKRLYPDYSEQKITLNIISQNADGEWGDIKYSGITEDDEFVTVELLSATAITLSLSANLTQNKRNRIITLYHDNVSDVTPLTIYLNQTYQGVKDIDYITIDTGWDFLSGEKFDLMLYAPTMPFSLQKYKCVGMGSAKYLANKELTIYSEDELDDKGDTTKYSIAWAGGNADKNYGFNSYIISINEIFSDEFITQEIQKGNDYFDFDIYGAFRNKKRSGVISLNISEYTEGNGTSITTNTNSHGWGTSFYIKNGSLQAKEKYNFIIDSCSNEDYVNFNNESGGTYTKIGSIRYYYGTGNITTIFEDGVKTGTDSDDEKNSTITQLNDNGKDVNIKYYGTVDTGFVDNSYSNSGVSKVYFGTFLNNGNKVKYYTTVDDNGRPHIGTKSDCTLSGFCMYYDQTMWQITSITRNLNSEWISDGDKAFEYTWSITSDTSIVESFYYNLGSISSINPETDKEKSITRNVFMRILSGATDVTIPKKDLTGTLYDNKRNEYTSFTISPSSGIVTWNTTEEADTNENYVTFEEMNNQDTSLFTLMTVKTDDLIPFQVTYTGSKFKSFQFNYNNVFANKLVMIWGKTRTVTPKITVNVVNVTGHKGEKATLYIGPTSDGVSFWDYTKCEVADCPKEISGSNFSFGEFSYIHPITYYVRAKLQVYNELQPESELTAKTGSTISESTDTGLIIDEDRKRYNAAAIKTTTKNIVLTINAMNYFGNLNTANKNILTFDLSSQKATWS